MYLELLDVPPAISDMSTICLTETNLQDIWCAFQTFACIPLECQSQIFSFEYYYSMEYEQLSITFRRNFYIPFEDDPNVLIPLCFAVGTDYSITKPAGYKYIFFLTEVEANVDKAVQSYCNEVEQYRLFWEPFLMIEPSQVSVFQ